MGRPFPGIDVRIVDEDLHEVGIGEVGQIAVRVKPEKPPSLMLEYWKNPEENAAVFRATITSPATRPIATPTAIYGSSDAPTT